MRLLGPQRTGIDFDNRMSVRYDVNFLDYNYAFNGSGVAVGDVNGDGLEDIFFGGNVEHDRLYLNQGGMRFRDATAESGIAIDSGWTTGVSMADVNADGYLDIYVCRAWHLHDPDARRDLMYINDGHGHFSEQGREMGLADTSFSSMAAFFDADNDGDLDLYLVTHPIDFEDKYEYTNHLLVEKGINLSDHFYENEGNGHFRESHLKWGVNNHGYGLGIGLGYFNGDRRPDVYVSNDFSMNDQVLFNTAIGRFEDRTDSVLRKMCYYGMGVDVADLDGDLLPDILVADMGLEVDSIRKTFMYQVSDASFNDMLMSGYLHQYARNTLQLGTRHGHFIEVANLAGMARTDWSWSPLMFDMDHDGRRDVFISNGYFLEFNVDDIIRYGELVAAVRRSDREEFNRQVAAIRPVQMPATNRFFINRGELRFDESSSHWGLNTPTISHGAAVSDLDNDGDLDIVTNNCNSPAGIYENLASQNGKGSLVITLFGSAKNRSGIGAEVRLLDKDSLMLDVAWQFPVRGYWSSSTHRIHFGMERASEARSLQVIWPDGRVTVSPLDSVNGKIVVRYSDYRLKSSAFTSEYKVESEHQIEFRHKENRSSGFSARSMLPFGHGTLGPGAAVADVNNDGLDDVFIGGAAGQSGSLLIQHPGGALIPTSGPWAADAAFEDMGILMADLDGDRNADILVANGIVDHVMAVQRGLRFYRGLGNGQFRTDTVAFSGIDGFFSCITSHDMDGDGDLDIFVGGRHAGTDYPLSPRSYLFRNEGNGRFTDVTEIMAPGLREVGMVSSAVWTPIDGDSLYDLVLVGEWMPITVFAQKNNLLVPKRIMGFEDTDGLWNSVISVDVDADGDMDLVCGNMGPNTDISPKAAEPMQLHTADFDQDGVRESVLSYVNEGRRTTWRDFQKCAQQVPILAGRIKNSTAFARLDIHQAYGAKAIDQSHTLLAKTLHSICALNDGRGRFEVRPLPWQAQVSSIFGLVPLITDKGVSVAYHGNFFNTEADFSRQDAGSGGLLVFDKDGNVKVVDDPSTKWAGEGRSMVNTILGEDRSLVIANGSGEESRMKSRVSSALKWPENAKYANVRIPDGRKMRLERSPGGYLSNYDSQPLFGISTVSSVEFH